MNGLVNYLKAIFNAISRVPRRVVDATDPYAHHTELRRKWQV